MEPAPGDGHGTSTTAGTAERLLVLPTAAQLAGTRYADARRAPEEAVAQTGGAVVGNDEAPHGQGEATALLLVTPRERRMLQVIERVTGQKVGEVKLPNAQQVLDARIKKLTSSLAPLVADAEASHGDLLDRLTADIGCSPRALAAALLKKATNGQALDLASVEREQPLVPGVGSAPRERRERDGDRGGERGEYRERRAPMPLAEGRVRCRTALGTRDGIAAKNLLGAILNEGGLAREAIGRIQIRETFSLVELPEDGLDRLLGKLKDTRVAGKALKLRRYRED